MRKTIILAVIACILGIIILSALAFYIPSRLKQPSKDSQSEAFTGFQFATEDPGHGRTDIIETDKKPSADISHEAETAGETLFHDTDSDVPDTEAAAALTEKLTEAAAHYADLPAHVAAHQIIWAGDSRTLGLRDALHKAGRTDEDLFVGKVGEGVRWFREEGMAQLSDMIEEYPDAPVVMNFGVNDPQLIGDYVVAYWDVIRAHPDTDFYILSVNPLDEEFLIRDGQVNEAVFDDINSLNVARMNVKLSSEFQSRYIDSASYLKADGFETVDGLHFSTQTYLKIHDFVVSQLF